jgi:hypothetical protein
MSGNTPLSSLPPDQCPTLENAISRQEGLNLRGNDFVDDQSCDYASIGAE